MPTARCALAAAGSGGRLFAIGGIGASGQLLATVEVLDLEAG
eukprot:gene725-6788_t